MFCIYFGTGCLKLFAFVVEFSVNNMSTFFGKCPEFVEIETKQTIQNYSYFAEIARLYHFLQYTLSCSYLIKPQ